MRMALVEIVGMLIKEIAMSEEGEQESREKKINNLFELLTERFLDLSSYVRAKVINTLSKLCEYVFLPTLQSVANANLMCLQPSRQVPQAKTPHHRAHHRRIRR